MLKKWTLGCFFQCSLYDSHSYQSGEVRRGSVAYWSERRQGRVVGRFLSYNNTADYTLNPHTYTRTHTLTRVVSLSVAGECPVWEARVMAQYAPPAYALSDEQEYLQAYEDVLEKYKGRRVSVEWICVSFRAKKKLPDCCLTVQQMSACSPRSLSLVTGWCSCLYHCCGKSGNISCMTSHLGWFWIVQTKGFCHHSCSLNRRLINYFI